MGKMIVWYDQEGDYLEIGLSRTKGYFKDAGNDIWERLDRKGKIIGMAILNFRKRLSRMKAEVKLPFEIAFRG